MPMTADELAALDRQHLWHPFTQQRSWVDEDFPIIERADDTTLYDTEGTSVRAYQVPTTSFIVVVDRTGRVVYTGSGGDQDLVPILAQLTTQAAD